MGCQALPEDLSIFLGSQTFARYSHFFKEILPSTTQWFLKEIKEFLVKMEKHAEFFHLSPLRNSIYESNPPITGGEYKILVEAKINSVGGLLPVMTNEKTRKSIFLPIFKQPQSDEIVPGMLDKVRDTFQKVVNLVAVRQAPSFPSRRARWGWRTAFHHACYGGSSPYTAFAKKYYKVESELPQGILTRVRDGIEFPSPEQWLSSHKKIMNGPMPIKLKSFSIEFLNRTLVSLNKLKKFDKEDSGVNSSICILCKKIANTEHALFECKFPQFCSQIISDFLDAKFHNSVPWISVNKRNLFLYSCFIDEIPKIVQYEIILLTLVMKSRFLHWSASNKWENWSKLTYTAQMLNMINRATFILKAQNKQVRILNDLYDHLSEVLL